MKKYLSLILSLVSLMMLTGCQDEEFGYTQEDVFKAAYERNFIKAFGPVNPEETWDFSLFGRRPQNGGAATRAGEPYFEVSDALRDAFLRGTLAQGGDHSNDNNTFCLLSGNDHFTITPIYKGSTTTPWSLHLVMFTPDNTSYDVVVWNNTMDPATQPVLEVYLSDHCDHCDDRGYIGASGDDAHKAAETMKCPNCFEGYLDTPVDQNQQWFPCTNCVDGKIVDENGVCPTCMGGGGSTCNQCGGKGYTFTGNGNNRRYYSCGNCCSDGAHDIFGKGMKNKEFRIPENQEKLKKAKGSGVVECPTCKGTGKAMINCNVCGGDAKIYICNLCNGTDLVHKCNNTAVHELGGNWVPITGNNPTVNHTLTAPGIRGYTYSTASLFASKGLVNGAIPAGSIFYFYLETSRVASSLNGGMLVFHPQGIDDNAMVIGCEEGDGDKDFNDLVFLLQGNPVVIPSKEKATFNTSVPKRYMSEDFGSNSDWDFNDIVVDVTRTTTHTLNGTGKELTKTSTNRDDVTIKWLGGTAPIQLTVGSKVFPKIEHPTHQSYTSDVLSGENELETPNDDGAPGWPVNLLFSNISGWDPDANNISVQVWRESWDNGTGTSGTPWNATFPEPGNVPYIIATGLQVDWKHTDGDSFDLWALTEPYSPRPANP